MFTYGKRISRSNCDWKWLHSYSSYACREIRSSALSLNEEDIAIWPKKNEDSQLYLRSTLPEGIEILVNNFKMFILTILDRFVINHVSTQVLLLLLNLIYPLGLIVKGIDRELSKWEQQLINSMRPKRYSETLSDKYLKPNDE